MIAERHWMLLWLLAGAWLLYLLSPILTPFLAAALLAYLGDPLVDRLEERKIPRTLAVSLVFLILFVVLALLAGLLIPRIEAQIATLIQKLPQYAQWMRDHGLPRLEQWLPLESGSLDLESLRASLSDHWSKAGGLLAKLVGSVSASGLAVIGWLTNLLLIPVLTFYLLRDWDRLVDAVATLLPRSSMSTWSRLASESDEVLGAFLRGQLLVMAGLGIIYTTGLWLFGLDFALLIGMFAGIVSFVPYLGLILGILIAGVASILQFKGIDMLPAVILVFVVGQVIEGFLLTPNLVGERIGLHPVAVIFAVMAGAQLYGFFGILIALPVAAVVLVLLRHLVANYRASGLYLGDKEDAEDKS